MISKKIDKRIMAARVSISNKYPYFSSGLWLMRFYETDLVPSMGITDKLAVVYNPNFLDIIDQKELEGVLVHELMHVLRNHSDRRLGRDFKKWNYAGDLEINDRLLDDGFSLPVSENFRVLLCEDFGVDKDLTAEEYYEKIPEPPNQQGSVCQGSCGSGAGNNKEDWEKEVDVEESSFGEKQVTKVDVDLAKEQIAKEIHHYKRTTGNVPGGLLRWAEDFLKPPQIDWRKQLAFKIRKTINSLSKGLDNYSYKRPSRRAVCCPDVIMPSMIASEPPSIGVIVDTSGSIAENELSDFLSEIQGILQSTGKAKVRVVSCDAVVHTDINVRKISDLREKIIGCGGTDLREGFKAFEEKDKPSICIVFTDGYTPWPEKSPVEKTIVVLCSDTSAEVPDWADSVQLN